MDSQCPSALRSDTKIGTSLRAPGLHAVGGPVPGLALQVTQTPGNPLPVVGAESHGGRSAASLRPGAHPAVSLAAARQRAEHMHRDIRENHDPGTNRQERAKAAAAAARSMTFKTAAEQYIEERRPRLEKHKHIQQWETHTQELCVPGHRGRAGGESTRPWCSRSSTDLAEKTETAPCSRSDQAGAGLGQGARSARGRESCRMA